MLEAAFDLAVENGPAALTMEAIARRSSVSKETLYRWWRSKSEVVLEALVDYGEEAIPIPDTGACATDLDLFLQATARALNHPTKQLLLGLAAGAASDPRFAEVVRDQFLSHRRNALGSLLERAAQRGDIPPERTETMLDLVFGSLWYRLIFQTGPFNKAWAHDITKALALPNPQIESRRRGFRGAPPPRR